MDADPKGAKKPALRRTLSLPMLTLYGVGTLVGGGFYALVGKVAGLAGPHAALALGLSALIALFSALTFSELAARYPYAGGPARYVQEAFARPRLTQLVGLTVIVTGVVSAATLANAVVAFVGAVMPAAHGVGIFVTVALLTGVAAWGTGESVAVAVAITLLEVGGLVFVAVVARGGIGESAANLGALLPTADPSAWSGLLLASFLAFYAFIGFEDLVTMAEEVKRPEKTVPRAIVLSLGITTALYVVVALAALGTLPSGTLATAENPLVAVIEAAGVRWVAPMVVISVLAGVNGALVQVVMGARVLYGMASEHRAPTVFAKVNERTRTPVVATLAVGVAVLAFAWLLPLLSLARTTSLLLLAVFAVVNVALLALKRRPNDAFVGTRYPVAVPAIGALLSAGFVIVELVRLMR